jgi:hypothetical protein
MSPSAEGEPNLAKVNAAIRRRAEEWGHPPDRVRRRLVFERLLDRLTRLQDAPTWGLAGGQALLLTIQSGGGRPTRDMDLALVGMLDMTGDVVDDLLRRACMMDLGDGFQLAVSDLVLASRMEDIGNRGFRARVVSQFRGLRFETVELDVAIHESVGETVPRHVDGVLPWVDPFDVPTVPSEVTFAEKLHATTRRYGENRDRLSTRPRDLPDMVALIREGALDPERTREAIGETFRRRGTHDLPAELVLPPGFEGAFARYGDGYGLEAMTADEGIAVLARFLKDIGVLNPDEGEARLAPTSGA